MACAPSIESGRGAHQFKMFRFLALACAAFFAMLGLGAQPMQLQALSERSFFAQGDLGLASTANRGFNANAGVVIGPQAVILVDALGTPALAEELLEEVRLRTSLPITHVIVTHYHADHFYGLQVFKKLGARIVAARPALAAIGSEAMQERLAERRISLAPWIDESFELIAPDWVIDAPTRIEMGGSGFWLLPAGPAHTPEDLMVLSEDDGVLFAGDLMFAGRIPFVGSADTAGWIRSLEDLIRRKPRVIVGGHGPASRDAPRDLAFTLDYLKYLRRVMAKAVQDLKSFDEAYAEADWSAYKDIPAFDAANRRNAYNVYLTMEEEALRR